MIKRIIGCGVILLVVAGIGSQALAVSVSEDDVYDAGTMVVTATRRAESITAVPANVTVISLQDIQNSTARDVPELLRSLAGVHVNDITGNRRNYTVDLRGFGETAGLNSLVLVDGRRTNQADLSGVDWMQIPLDRVEKIEIIPGGRASILYGDNAAGGVINILTKKGKALSTGGSLSTGSYDTFQANAYVRGAANGITYGLSGSYLDSDGYRDNSETDSRDFGMDLGYEGIDWVTINASFGYHKDNTNLPGAIKTSEFAAGADRTDTFHPDDFADTEDTYVQVAPEIYFLSSSMVKIDASYRKRRVSNYASGDWGNFTGGFDIETVIFSPQVLINEPVFGKDNHLSMGLDYTDAEEDITNTSTFYGFTSTDMVDMEKKNTGAYIHEELLILPGLSCSAGYRYDRSKYKFTSSANPDTSSETTFDEELFTAGINFQLKPGSNVYISFSRSFRYPVLDEVFSFFTNSIVEGLIPQKSEDIEIGVRHACTDTLRIAVNLFKMDTENEIIYNPNTYANENLDGDTDRYGAEISVEQRFGWGNLGAAYTYTRAQIDGGQFDDNDFPNVPEHQASVKTLVDIWKPLTLAINATYIGKRPFISDFGDAFSDQEEYVVVNAKIQYHWKKVTAFVDVNNIFNEEYSEYGTVSAGEPGYYPSPKANFMVGVSLAL